MLGLLVRFAPAPVLSRLAAWRPASPRGDSVGRLSTAELGVLGEELAARYLRGLGYVLIGRNLEAVEAELDIVAIDGDTLVVVEVKAGWCPLERQDGPRGPHRWGHRRPGARIPRSGVARRLRAARRLAKGAGLPLGRVDAMEVVAGRGPLVELVHHRAVTPGAPLGR